MPGLSQHQGRLVVYDADHVDTDRIIPARFLTMITRSGYGELLFKDVRGEGFPLDDPAAAGATVMVVGTNFGCGSSREHAVWAIQQAGFVAVIARRKPDIAGFSDIFRQNAVNCGLLLIELDEAEHHAVAALGTGAELAIDVLGQTLSAPGLTPLRFEITEAFKKQVMEGHDLIGTTLEVEEKIRTFEARWSAFAPPAA